MSKVVEWFVVSFLGGMSVWDWWFRVISWDRWWFALDHRFIPYIRWSFSFNFIISSEKHFCTNSYLMRFSWCCTQTSRFSPAIHSWSYPFTTKLFSTYPWSHLKSSFYLSSYHLPLWPSNSLYSFLHWSHMPTNSNCNSPDKSLPLISSLSPSKWR